MADRETTIKGLMPILECAKAQKWGAWVDTLTDAVELLKDQTTTDTAKSRIFHCEKCGYGIDDIFLSDEHNYQIEPRFCPNCGRLVKYESICLQDVRLHN